MTDKCVEWTIVVMNHVKSYETSLPYVSYPLPRRIHKGFSCRDIGIFGSFSTWEPTNWSQNLLENPIPSPAPSRVYTTDFRVCNFRNFLIWSFGIGHYAVAGGASQILVPITNKILACWWYLYPWDWWTIWSSPHNPSLLYHRQQNYNIHDSITSIGYNRIW